MLDIDADLGYYLCNGVTFMSKVDACIYASSVKKPIEWIFHQDIFSKYPWHIEPQESLDYFYDKRARELRERYDYIILNYSGGVDSNNMLESFARQGLHIDEIVTNHLTKATESTMVLDPRVRSSWNLNAEYKLHVVHRLNEIQNRLPRTKITSLDVSDSVFKDIEKYKEEDWTLHRCGQLSPTTPLRHNYFYFSEVKKQLDKNLKVGVIQGVDKPITLLDNDNFYFMFTDIATGMTTPGYYNEEYENVKTELFYWSVETMPMVCKQVHTVKRWLEERPARQQYWSNASWAVSRLYHEKFLRNIVYTTWNNDWYQADKGINWWHTEFDDWFRNNKQYEKHYANWERGIKTLVNMIPDYIIYKDGVPDGLKKFQQRYFVGKLKNLYKA